MEGHILVVRQEWLDRVLSTSIYYTGLRTAKGWGRGDLIFLISRTNAGQCFVAYGSIKSVRTELTEEEKSFCLENGWNIAIELEDLKEIRPPVPVDDTPVKVWKLRGRFLHGRKISDQDQALLEALP